MSLVTLNLILKPEHYYRSNDQAPLVDLLHAPTR